jgi:hypothetical protein
VELLNQRTGRALLVQYYIHLAQIPSQLLGNFPQPSELSSGQPGGHTISLTAIIESTTLVDSTESGAMSQINIGKEATKASNSQPTCSVAQQSSNMDSATDRPLVIQGMSKDGSTPLNRSKQMKLPDTSLTGHTKNLFIYTLPASLHQNNNASSKAG